MLRYNILGLLLLYSLKWHLAAHISASPFKSDKTINFITVPHGLF